MRYDVLKTPKELQLEEGQFIYLKDLSKPLHRRKKVLKDFLSELPPRVEPSDLLDL